MRFIRVHGRVIPIKDGTAKPGRLTHAGEAAGSAAIAAGAVHGLSRVAASQHQTSIRTAGLAKKALKRSEKTLSRLQGAMMRRKAPPKFRERMTTKVVHNITKHERLAATSARAAISKTVLKRTSFVAGGLALGNAIDKGIQAISGHKTSDKTKVAAHTVGISTAAVASSVLSRSRICKAAKIHKIVKFLKR